MRFGPVAVDDARGAILAHSHRLGRHGTLRKGLVLNEEHLGRLRDAGHDTVVVAQLDPDDVGEDEAAARLARLVAGPNVELGAARTGRVNLFATAAGVLAVDKALVDAINAVYEGITVATLAAYATAQPGELIGTVKIIPYAVPGHMLRAAEAAATTARPAVRVAPLMARRVGLVLSRLPGLPPRLLERAADIQRDRLAALGAELVQVDICDHDAGPVSTAISAQLDAGLDPVLFLGASAIIDREDVLPAAIVDIGGTVDQLGMPVDPGNLLLLASRGDRTILGLPGCARSAKLSGFDWVLRRVLAGLDVSPAEIRGLGVGGLLKEIPVRPSPRRGSPSPARRVAAIVLAAGGSSRMGERNKLLVDLAGEPLVARTVDTLLHSHARPVVVVTGHQRDAVEAALDGKDVTLVHNASWADGMSTSIRAGLDALPDDVAGAMLALGDMPFVRPKDVEALIQAFAPEGGAPICVPMHDRKRGHPVVWAKRFFHELHTLSGDVGARAVLDAHMDEVHLVPIEDPGVHVDVDTPEALAAVRAGDLPDLSKP